MKDKILEVLAQLNVENDEHWTGEGLPRLDVVKDLLGQPVSRAEVTEACKTFSRSNPHMEVKSEAEELQNEFAANAEAQEETLQTKQEASDQKTEKPEEELEEQEPEEEEELENKVVLEKRLEKARKALGEAQAEYQAALEAMDELIEHEETQGKMSHAELVKAWHKAQDKQAREKIEKEKKRQQLLKEAGLD